MKPSDYPIRWEYGFGWGSWKAVWNLVFPPSRPWPAGYDVLPVGNQSLWWLLWPYWKLQRLGWAMRGPV